MERWQNRVAVVTGASSGIGAAIAKDLVKAGLIVAALARRKELLEEIRSSLPANLQKKFHPIKCDVSDLKSVNESFDWIEKNLGGVDILVNNAGIHKPGQIATQNIADLQTVLNTNLMSMIYCTQRAFKSMKARNFDGHVILLNSVVGHSIFNPPGGAVATFGIYPSTKYGVTAMNEVLRQEFRDLKTKIKVTSITPGLVETPLVEEFKNVPKLNPEDISAGVMYAISTPPHVQVHELTIKPVGEAF